MNKKSKTKLLKELINLAPNSPSVSTKKNNKILFDELIQMRPENPYLRASGIKIISKMTIPSRPKN